MSPQTAAPECPSNLKSVIRPTFLPPKAFSYTPFTTLTVKINLQKMKIQNFRERLLHGKKWFCYGNKIRTTNEFFVASTKNFAAATKRFVDRTKHFVVVTKYFCCPYFNK